MDIKELKQKSEAELKGLLFDAKKNLADLKKKILTGELKKVSAIGAARKLIARIETLNRANKK